MSIVIGQKFSHPPEVFLSEILYVELPKNLVICFKGTLVSLLLQSFTKYLRLTLVFMWNSALMGKV